MIPYMHAEEEIIIAELYSKISASEPRTHVTNQGEASGQEQAGNQSQTQAQSTPLSTEITARSSDDIRPENIADALALEALNADAQTAEADIPHDEPQDQTRETLVPENMMYAFVQDQFLVLRLLYELECEEKFRRLVQSIAGRLVHL
jgi:hypothetical protein